MVQRRVALTGQVLVLSYVLLLAGLAVHEVGHLVVLHLMGGTGALLIVPWRLGSMNYYIYGLHVEPTPPLSLPNQVILNFFGPVLAIIPFGFLLHYVKDRVPRAALIANILILMFFAVLESGFEWLESVLNRQPGILGSPEFNIGISIIIIIIVVYKMVWKRN